MSSEGNESSRPQFGGRLLLDEADVFKHNAWDNVQWGETQEKEALAAVLKNSEVTLTSDQLKTIEQESSRNWNKFYEIHQNRFFKDRNWLFTEFPELAPHLTDKFPMKVSSDSSSSNTDVSLNSSSQPTPTASSETTSGNEQRNVVTTNMPCNSSDCDNSSKTLYSNGCDASTDACAFPGLNASYRIFEIGCGVGNTIFPVLDTNDDKGLFIYGADFSATAIDIIKQHPNYDTNRCHVFVLDVSEESWHVPFPEASLDVITCIYLLSAIHPSKHANVAAQISRYLRPGGVVLFRDYGRYDLAQLRFKKGKCLADNCYMRGDGTKSYFFTQDEVGALFTGAGLKEKQNIVDRRLQVNRGKKLTMYRVWIQAKFTKPSS